MKGLISHRIRHAFGFLLRLLVYFIHSGPIIMRISSSSLPFPWQQTLFFFIIILLQNVKTPKMGYL